MALHPPRHTAAERDVATAGEDHQAPVGMVPQISRRALSHDLIPQQLDIHETLEVFDTASVMCVHAIDLTHAFLVFLVFTIELRGQLGALDIGKPIDPTFAHCLDKLGWRAQRNERHSVLARITHDGRIQPVVVTPAPEILRRDQKLALIELAPDVGIELGLEWCLKKLHPDRKPGILPMQIADDLQLREMMGVLVVGFANVYEPVPAQRGQGFLEGRQSGKRQRRHVTQRAPSNMPGRRLRRRARGMIGIWHGPGGGAGKHAGCHCREKERTQKAGALPAKPCSLHGISVASAPEDNCPVDTYAGLSAQQIAYRVRDILPFFSSLPVCDSVCA